MRGPRTAYLVGGALLVGVALVLAAMTLAGGESGDADPVAAAAPTTVRPTTSESSPPTTLASTSAPPTTAPPPSLPDDSAEVALEFLVAVADEEVVRECRAAEYVVRRDHPGAELRVALVGDSLTVQTVELLVSDTRFDWTVVSVCGARVDHFSGEALFESSYDLTSGLDAALADQPDIFVFALGTNDALRETYESRAVEHGPSLTALLDRTGWIRCRAWVDVHTYTSGAGGPYERYAFYATRFNEALATHVGAAGIPLLGWAGAVEGNDPARLLSPDGVHLTAEGRAQRARLIAEALTGLANDCVLAPPPTEPPTTQAPSPPPTPAPTTTTTPRPGGS